MNINEAVKITHFKEVHSIAMDFAEEAFRLKRKALKQFELALKYEKMAFDYIKNRDDCNETKTVFEQSVKALKLNVKKLKGGKNEY